MEMKHDDFLKLAGKEIGEALSLPAEKVAPEAGLRRDLGAESIDLIDLTFRFEKALGRPLAEEEVFRAAGGAEDVTVAEVARNLEKILAEKR